MGRHMQSQMTLTTEDYASASATKLKQNLDKADQENRRSEGRSTPLLDLMDSVIGAAGVGMKWAKDTASSALSAVKDGAIGLGNTLAQGAVKLGNSLSAGTSTLVGAVVGVGESIGNYATGNGFNTNKEVLQNNLAAAVADLEDNFSSDKRAVTNGKLANVKAIAEQLGLDASAVEADIRNKQGAVDNEWADRSEAKKEAEQLALYGKQSADFKEQDRANYDKQAGNISGNNKTNNNVYSVLAIDGSAMASIALAKVGHGYGAAVILEIDNELSSAYSKSIEKAGFGANSGTINPNGLSFSPMPIKDFTSFFYQTFNNGGGIPKIPGIDKTDEQGMSFGESGIEYAADAGLHFITGVASGYDSLKKAKEGFLGRSYNVDLDFGIKGLTYSISEDKKWITSSYEFISPPWTIGGGYYTSYSKEIEKPSDVLHGLKTNWIDSLETDKKKLLERR